MKEQLITFKTAKLAKEKGFSLGRHDYPRYDPSGDFQYINYTIGISAPTQSLLQKWLREKKNIFVYCMPTMNNKSWHNNIASHNPSFIGTYEEALEISLQEALKLIVI
jgi:hypothetical protein